MVVSLILSRSMTQECDPEANSKYSSLDVGFISGPFQRPLHKAACNFCVNPSSLRRPKSLDPKAKTPQTLSLDPAQSGVSPATADRIAAQLACLRAVSRYTV